MDVDCAVNMTFSGDDPTNSVEFWMQKFREYAQGRGLTPGGTLEAATRKLTGSARTWFSYQDNINTWQHFQEGILAEFKTKAPKIQGIMGSKKKQPCQSIMNYIHEMRLLGYRAQMNDLDIMEMIIKGATEDKYLRAILRTTTCFNTLRKVLEGFEEDSKSHNPVTHCPTAAKTLPYSRPASSSKPQLIVPAAQTAAVQPTPTTSMQPVMAPAASIVTPMAPVYAYATTNPFYGYRYRYY